MIKNAIVLAGGHAKRLSPLSNAINKALFNVNGKAIIDYSLSTLKEMGIENVAIILGGSHTEQVINYLENGDRYNMSFTYLFQGEPKGISQAINLAKKFAYNDDKFVVILSDNLYSQPIKWKNEKGAQIVLFEHPELKRFGVASILNDKIIKIEEKPIIINSTYSNYAITGCYLFDHRFFDFFKKTTPSTRQEYEITSIIEQYNQADSLNYTFANELWMDLGTFDAINTANAFLHTKTNKYRGNA